MQRRTIHAPKLRGCSMPEFSVLFFQNFPACAATGNSAVLHQKSGYIWARVSSMAGIICFLRLTTPGSTTLPSASRSQRKAVPIS